MRTLARAAARDYNAIVAATQHAATVNNLDTIVSVIKCGIGPGTGRVEREIINSSVHALRPVADHEYLANGGSTPLFDSVGSAIELFKGVPDYDDTNVAFLVQVITDGEENSSSARWKNGIGEAIRELQASDRWTFAFRVPRGYAKTLARFGIPEGNILEWEQSEHGMAQASAATVEAVSQFYAARALGAKSSQTFYSNLRDVKPAEIQAAMEEITGECQFFKVDTGAGDISSFVAGKTGVYDKGSAFYELVKREKIVQDHKIICIRDRNSGKVYSGLAARRLLGLSQYGNVALSPGDHGQYDIFIQSTSTNRRLPLNSNVLVWRKVRRM
jgi:hypothetical protein